MSEHLNDKDPRTDYDKRTHRWSEASARKYNNPYPNEIVEFIDWDDPEYEVTPNDPRWILPENFDLGAHPWYQSLPEEEKIRIGMYRYAQVARVGSEFEEGLISGIAFRNIWLPSDSEEKRYSTHEAEEEERHILMFDGLVKQIGVKPKGAPEWFRNSLYLAPPVAKLAPVAFWAIVLGGEEPIDTIQRELLNQAKQGAEIHPLLHRVMQVHVEEEARHIGFANKFLEENIKKLNPIQRKTFSSSIGKIHEILANVIIRPSAESLREMGVPKQVADEVWWNSDSGQKAYQSLFTRAQRRYEKLGMKFEVNENKPTDKVVDYVLRKCGVNGPVLRKA